MLKNWKATLQRRSTTAKAIASQWAMSRQCLYNGDGAEAARRAWHERWAGSAMLTSRTGMTISDAADAAYAALRAHLEQQEVGRGDA
jgi:hypothetical protein